MLNELFGIPNEWVPAMVVAGLLYFIASLFPILYPAYVIARSPIPIPRRLLLVATVCGQSYGYLFLFWMALAFPLQLYFIFVYPQLAAVGKPYGEWLAYVAEFFENYWYFFIPIVLAAWTVGVTRYLLPRWARIVDVLQHG